jgi:hypothetical protein
MQQVTGLIAPAGGSEFNLGAFQHEVNVITASVQNMDGFSDNCPQSAYHGYLHFWPD